MNDLKKQVARFNIRIADMVPVAVLACALVIYILWVCPWVDLIPTIPIDDNTPYLLSAVAQSMAAIIALPITISLVFVQLSSRYSSRSVRQLLDRFTLSYLFLLVLALILPIWFLIYPTPWGIEASLVLSTACVLLLPSYLWHLGRRISPEHTIVEIRDRCSRQIDDADDSLGSTVAELEGATMSAFDLKDYQTFITGVSALAALAYQAESLASVHHSDESLDYPLDTQYLNEVLTHIGTRTLREPGVGSVAIDAVWRLGSKALSDKNPRLVGRYIGQLSQLATAALSADCDDAAGIAVMDAAILLREAIDERMEEVLEDAQFSLHMIAQESAGRSKNYILSSTIPVFGRIGVYYATYANLDSARRLMDELSGVADLAQSRGWNHEVRLAALWLLRVGASGALSAQQSLEQEAAQHLVHLLSLIDAPRERQMALFGAEKILGREEQPVKDAIGRIVGEVKASGLVSSQN